ncbi:hypothetical protein OIV83_004147 [Microbotryomycetes sp. JL201]|nr:hypothetical protein OIV83_004147 [Microbotryomycetes sp. JL201]
MTVELMSEEELLERSPFLAKLQRRRPAPVRWAQLVAIARSSKPPKEPAPWDCCGSSCQPCVKELYKQEKRVWDEVHPDGCEQNGSEAADIQDEIALERDEISSQTAREARRDVQKAEQDRAGPRVEIDLLDTLDHTPISWHLSTVELAVPLDVIGQTLSQLERENRRLRLAEHEAPASHAGFSKRKKGE